MIYFFGRPETLISVKNNLSAMNARSVTDELEIYDKWMTNIITDFLLLITSNMTKKQYW